VLPPRRLLSSTAAKVIAGLSLVVVAGAVIRLIPRTVQVAPAPSNPETRPAPVAPVVAQPAVAPAPAIEETRAAPAPTTTAPPAASDAGREKHVASRRARAEAGGDDLAAERRLLEEARAALARGDGRSALAAADRHARTFPAGQLAEERESVRVRALVASGRLDEARARAERFRRRYPQSIFLPAIASTLDPSR
jgi:hypothetical protein